MMNENELQRAVNFVQHQGTDIERARLRSILYAEPAPDVVREQFERSQRGDGGWAAFWAPDYSSLDATCYQLAQADQLGIDRKSRLFVDAVRFLAERQHFDGSWEEEETEAGAAPSWAMPGDVAARLYVTANCGFWVAVTGLVQDAADDAAGYLSRQLDANGHLSSFPQAHWLAAALWRMQGMHDEAANALAYLQKRVPELSAGNLAWMILALREGGLPAADETVRAALIRMVELRDPAGHWPSDEGAGNAVHVTIEAIKSLQLAGNLS